MSDIGINEFEAIGQGVLEELNRRLGDEGQARDLPGTLLMKVAESYLKYLERKQAFEEAKANIEKIDPLEMVDQPGLPIELRVEILYEYLEDIEACWRNASTRMESLLKEVELGESDVVPELQDVVPEV